MSRITVLVGSPRKGGNTERLADAFIEGAEQAGNGVVKIHLGECRVNGCLGCDSCMKNGGKCVQDDDMQAVYEALYDSDVVVLATPIYCYATSAQLKAVMDRFYATITRPFPIGSAALLAVYGDESPSEADVAIAHYRALLRGTGWRDLGIVTASGVLHKGDIAGHASLRLAEELGKSLV